MEQDQPARTPDQRPQHAGRSRTVRRTLGTTVGLVLAALLSLSAAQQVHAGSGGLGSPCTVQDAHVSVEPEGQFLYTYQVDCSGPPLGANYTIGWGALSYQELGTWDPKTQTAYELLMNGTTDAHEEATWSCSADPWITAAQDLNNSIAGGHTCQLLSQRQGSDWTDGNNGSFGADMCVNDPWGASLAGCWGSDDIFVTGPSAAIQHAWYAAEQQAGAPTSLLPLPVGGGLNLGSLPTSGSTASPLPVSLPGRISLPGVPGPTPTPTPTPAPAHSHHHGG